MSLVGIVSMLGIKAINWERMSKEDDEDDFVGADNGEKGAGAVGNAVTEMGVRTAINIISGLGINARTVTELAETQADNASSYLDVTPRKKSPTRPKKDRKERAVKKRAEMKNYIKHLESVQEKLNAKDKKLSNMENKKSTSETQLKEPHLRSRKVPSGKTSPEPGWTRVDAATETSTTPDTCSLQSSLSMTSSTVPLPSARPTGKSEISPRNKRGGSSMTTTSTDTGVEEVETAKAKSLRASGVPKALNELRSAFEEKNVDKFLESLFGIWGEGEERECGTCRSGEKSPTTRRSRHPQRRARTTSALTRIPLRRCPPSPTALLAPPTKRRSDSETGFQEEEDLDSSSTSSSPLRRQRWRPWQQRLKGGCGDIADKETQVEFCDKHAVLVDEDVRRARSVENERESKRKMALVVSAIGELILNRPPEI